MREHLFRAISPEGLLVLLTGITSTKISCYVWRHWSCALYEISPPPHHHCFFNQLFTFWERMMNVMIVLGQSSLVTWAITSVKEEKRISIARYIIVVRVNHSAGLGTKRWRQGVWSVTFVIYAYGRTSAEPVFIFPDNHASGVCLTIVVIKLRAESQSLA